MKAKLSGHDVKLVEVSEQKEIVGIIITITRQHTQITHPYPPQ